MSGTFFASPSSIVAAALAAERGIEAARRADVDPRRYIFANYSPAFDKIHRQMLEGFAESPIASGQNAAVCGLLASLGGSAFVLEEAARELVASGACRYVEDVEAIPQAVYMVVHLRHRHAHATRKLSAIVRRPDSYRPSSAGRTPPGSRTAAPPLSRCLGEFVRTILVSSSCARCME